MILVRMLLPIALALFIAACATPGNGPAVVQLAEAPTLDQSERAVLSYLSRALKDPDSLKQFKITYGPMLIRDLVTGRGNEPAWLVCFEYNAKNIFGAYTGLKTYGVALQRYGNEATVVSSVNGIVVNNQCPNS
jgi:hypothetical protein